jgi:hypothetical protein
VSLPWGYPTAAARVQNGAGGVEAGAKAKIEAAVKMDDSPEHPPILSASTSSTREHRRLGTAAPERVG